ncbi:hypothetical protein CYY_000932 [Polysphondylium violaceum]|uniref:Mitochondrial glycoprotein family member n=1 Tax=Polysphondylium violaceum TaxID=133409 RepID=A0A8J4V206_9MYCE|nr:hypothetical protein CYY_000932 [Polysphondylium violaceum]
MSALGRNIGNFVLTFSAKRTSFATANGLKSGLLSCCGSTYTPLPKDNHHHHRAHIQVNSSKSGLKTDLFNANNNTFDYLSVRNYGTNNLQVAPTPKSLLGSICESEINDFKTIIPEGNDIEAFLEESGFELTKEKETAFLKKKFADGTQITVKFDLMEQNDPFQEDDEFGDMDKEDQDEDQEEDQEEEEQEEQDEEQEQDEDEDAENEDGEDGEQPHEHSFEVQLSKANGENKLTFGCFAAQDGNYTISGFYKGGFEDIVNPVDIGGTSEEFQTNILLLLEQYGVNERLSFFIHDYIHSKKLNDYIDSFQALKDFASEK